MGVIKVLGLVILAVLAFAVPGGVQARPPGNGVPPGQPFQALQNQINQEVQDRSEADKRLQKQIDELDEHGGGDNKSDFALFDGTNPANQGVAGVTNPLPTGVAGAVCGVSKPGKAFTIYVTVTNHSSGAPGFVRLTYKDGDFVQFPLAPGGSFSFSQAGGSKGGADMEVRISGVPGGATGTRLVGAMSILSAEDGKPFCVSCDATTEGGVGDAGCDARVPD